METTKFLWETTVVFRECSIFLVWWFKPPRRSRTWSSEWFNLYWNFIHDINHCLWTYISRNNLFDDLYFPSYCSVHEKYVDAYYGPGPIPYKILNDYTRILLVPRDRFSFHSRCVQIATTQNFTVNELWWNRTLEQWHAGTDTYACCVTTTRWNNHNCVPCNSHDAGTVTKRARTVTITHAGTTTRWNNDNAGTVTKCAETVTLSLF